MASSPLYYLLFLIPYLLILVRRNSSEIATIRPEESEEDKEAQPSVQSPTIGEWLISFNFLTIKNLLNY